MTQEHAEAADGQAQSAKAARAASEAAEWYAKLNNGRVAYGEIDKFFAWRAETLNDVAYTRIERLTTTARALADDPRLQALAERAARRPREGAWLARLGWPRPALFGGLGLLAAGLAAGALLWIQPFGQTYDTSVGERRAISLEDGSTVELNTDSRVRVRLGKTERRLELLKGQAMFAVAHDTGRPFIVTAGDTAVRAVGTKFEVYRTDGSVRVILTEGRVQVSRSGQTAKPVTMTAGERVEAAPGEALKAAPVDVAAATGWTQGRLTFQDAPLAQAVAEVNRYSRRHVVLGAGAPASERVNGVFDAGDTEAFAHGVAALLDLAAARRADGAIELTGRRPA